MPMGEAVDHLKVDHQVPEYRQNGSGTVNINWLPGSHIEVGKQKHCKPAIATFDERTVLLNAYSSNRRWEFWVTHLGGEKKAQKCDIKIVVSYEGSPTSITFQGKVYGADTTKVRSDIKDEDGVLELRKSLMKKMGQVDEGKLQIPFSYQLVNK